MKIYNFLINVYGAIIWVLQPFVPKAKLWIQGRRAQKLTPWTRRKQLTIWVHCSSLGEFEQGRPLMESVKERYPDSSIILTFFSPSGFEIRKNYAVADSVWYLPLDTKKNAREFISRVQPDLAVFVKYDFWFNYLSQLFDHKIPFIFISSIFTENHFLFKPWAKFLLKIFSRAEQVFVQDQFSLEILTKKNVSVTLAGDTRVDRVIQLQKKLKRYPKVEDKIGNRKVFIFGSIWPEDLAVVKSWISGPGKENYFIVVVTHDISERMLQKVETAIESGGARLSSLTSSDQAISWLLIDSIGDLAHLYALGDLAYVGGAFGKGLHSILEPIAARIPVIFGPKYAKFKEARELIKIGAVKSVNNPSEFAEAVAHFEIPTRQMEATQAIETFLNQHSGATAKIVQYLTMRNLLA